jgi:hypothetical protein
MPARNREGRVLAGRRLGTLCLVLVAGCGGRDAAAPQPQPRTTAATASAQQATDAAVAWRIDKDAARRLADGDALTTLRRAGHVAARGPSDGYAAVVLAEWLDARDVRLDPPPGLRATVERVAGEQEVSLLVFGRQHRRYVAKLAQLRPSARELRSFYARFTGEAASPGAADAMRGWLRVFRQAIRQTDVRHVVVVPVLD